MYIFSAFAVAAILSLILALPYAFDHSLPRVPNTGTLPSIGSIFVYSFNSPGILRESGSTGESTSPYWWVNSGGRMVIENGLGSTNIGELPITDRFRLLYSVMNPLDTEYGKYPQNTFRLISKHTWDDARLSAGFRIVKDNLTKSSNRNASNGLLFMSRYESSQTLYYAGIRVDGAAVIKKKYKGTYYTMAYKKIFDGTYSETTPNLLPHGEWINLRSETVTNADGSVTIRLYTQTSSGSWDRILEATDDGKKYGGTPPILGAHPAGIRTDFMDVQFENFRAESITR